MTKLDSTPMPLVEGTTPLASAEAYEVKTPMWEGAPRFVQMIPAACANPGYPDRDEAPWLFGRFYDRKRGKVLAIGSSLVKPGRTVSAEEFYKPPRGYR